MIFSLTSLSEDTLSHIMGFLEPLEFYNCKTVIIMDNDMYWWNKPINLMEAVKRQNASLTSWVLERLPRDGIQPRDIVSLVHYARIPQVQKVLYKTYISYWPEQIHLILEAFVVTGAINTFTWVSWKNPVHITDDIFDVIFLYRKWIMMACLFRHTPRQFILWCFGNYKQAADPDIIRSMRYILNELYPYDQVVLKKILKKYHEWLWQYKLNDVSTLLTIFEIHRLNIFEFDPHKYFIYAAKSQHPDFISYLIFKGLVVESNMLKNTNNLEQLKILYNTQVVQKYHNILVMLAVLLMAVIVNMIYRFRKNGHVEFGNTENEKALSFKTDRGWKFGLTVNI
jgi:hypothetical protein